MKYIAASVLVLAGVSSAAPVAQVSLPSFSLPTGSSEDPPAPSATDAPGLGSGAGGISGGLGGLLGGGTGGGLSGGLGGLLGGSGTGSGSGSGGLTGGLSGLSGLSGLLGKGSSSGSGGLSGGLGDLLGGGSSGSGSEDESSPAVTSTPTGSGESTPAPTGSAGGGSIGENCTPQGSGSSSENGVKDKNCCTDITVIFARGTGELGNVGTVSGPPMFTSLREKLGADRVTVQGVDYPASTAGNSNLGRDGGPEMAELVKSALSQCPSTKVILSGYSQGAMVVHNAMSQGVSSSEVAGAILFGDPLKTQAVGDLPENKVQQFCGTSDFICGGGGDGGATGSHLSYGSVAGTAADFAISVAGLA